MAAGPSTRIITCASWSSAVPDISELFSHRDSWRPATRLPASREAEGRRTARTMLGSKSFTRHSIGRLRIQGDFWSADRRAPAGRGDRLDLLLSGERRTTGN